jgi:hypothetical protein
MNRTSFSIILNNYRNTDNVKGENQNYLNVNGRKKAKGKTGSTIIEKIKLGGEHISVRSTRNYNSSGKE